MDEVKVTFVLRDGLRLEASGRSWQTLRDLAIDVGIPGLVGSCGGSCACGTCHVYVDSQWMDMVGEPGDVEQMGLDLAYDVRPTSRLGCQITLRPELDGLVVKVAENMQ